jgi:CheY-like chemotaxis protein
MMGTTAPTVLVIEDEPTMRRFLRTSLAANGYAVVEAATAREAWPRRRAAIRS